ncbi:MAG: UDP-galactopyranose mutase [Lachnospiraceae bacterium]|nr:UDP-galactopyranose mutase [Lachnospiraceae bacterium]
MRFPYVIVGAGLAGITMAERIASQMNEKVLIIEKRSHIGGNVYDSYDKEGILIHNYGPHTFHTNDKEVFDYICGFTEWNDYQHRVLSYVDGNFVPLPISLETINRLYNMNLSEDEMEGFIASRRIPIDEIKTSEDVVLSQGGRDIYEKFFKYFTIKQWGVSPAELDRTVISRIPFRKNRDTRYFTDQYQGNPKYGYTAMCQKMLDHPNIKIMLNTDYKEVIGDIAYDKLIYTGPIDYYFDNCYGELLYRSIRFQFETHDCESYQPVTSTRYPLDYDYTRITEFKKMTGQKHPKTTILKEFPCFGGEPYYPYPTQEWKALAERYRELARKEENVIFLGRLAQYKYYDMDDVIREALDVFEKLKS